MAENIIVITEPTTDITVQDNGYPITVSYNAVALQTGPQGIPGPQGPIGPQGPAGVDGIIGRDGEQGPQGLTGDTGPQGPAGADGSSAYQVAIENGFVGTEAEWLASLVGPQGPMGPQGIQGLTGAIGPQGIQGIQGDTGSQGPQGDVGPQGIQGITGDTGPSAYQVAVETGFVGTETEWLASLVGPQGIQGIPGDVGPQGPIGETGASGANFAGDLLGSTITDSVNLQVRVQAQPTPITGFPTTGWATYANSPTYTNNNLNVVGRKTIGIVQTANVGVTSGNGSNQRTAGSLFYNNFHATSNMTGNDRAWGTISVTGINLNGYNWNGGSFSTIGSANNVEVRGAGFLGNGLGVAGGIGAYPAAGENQTINTATAVAGDVYIEDNPGTGAITNIGTARLFSGSMGSNSGTAINTAIGLDLRNGWHGGANERFSIRSEDSSAMLYNEGDAIFGRAISYQSQAWFEDMGTLDIGTQVYAPIQEVNILGNITFTSTSVNAPRLYSFIFIQPVDGGKEVTWPLGGGNGAYFNVNGYLNKGPNQSTYCEVYVDRAGSYGVVSYLPNYSMMNIRQIGDVSGDVGTLVVDMVNCLIMTAVGNISINDFNFYGDSRPVAIGKTFKMIIKQDAVGGHTLTTNLKFRDGFKTLTATPNAVNMIDVFYDGTTYYADLTNGYS